MLLSYFYSSKLYLILFNSLCGLSIAAVGTIAITDQAMAKGLDRTNATITVTDKSHSKAIARGRLAYQSGRYAEANKIWQETIKQAQDRQYITAQAQILNYLALSEEKLGNSNLATVYLQRSLELISEPTSDRHWQIKAQALNARGNLELATGKAKAALASWQAAEAAYQKAGDKTGALGANINRSQAWQSLGLYRRAQKTLAEIATELETHQDPSLKITGLRSLGIALQVTGDLEAAEKMLEQSLALSETLNLPEESNTTLFGLANNALAKEDKKQAIKYYQQVAATTARPLLKTEARLNQLGLLISTEQWQSAQDLLREIKADFDRASTVSTRRSIYAKVNLAKHSIALAKRTGDRSILDNTRDSLISTIDRADLLEDPQAQSYVLGMLGYLYESDRQLDEGREHTLQAVRLAHTIDNSELIYQWQWQLGRINSAQGDRQGAIAAYRDSVEALESLRSDLVVTNANLQYSFREQVEPVYRQLVGLLLAPDGVRSASQADLQEARKTIESLQLAELHNFFREACLDATPTAIDEIDRQAAVIYPIILSDRLEVIVSLPDKSLRHYSQSIPRPELESVIEELRQTLQIRSRRTFYQPAQKLYSWLIAPALEDLARHEIETLVFVPDGSLRNIPFSALYDGKQYLIEQYNVALTPGLQLLAPKPLEQVKLKTLAAGITQQRRGFTSLEYVNQELLDIQNQTDSLVLRDDRFTTKLFRQEIQSAKYPIVHIATHGQFSSSLEDTFLLAWDDEININELSNILSHTDSQQKQAIELLILSACETARGDKQAALGLAGMSVRAGARTTLATLWAVYDESTALTMDSFYQNIARTHTKLNKAQALRQAQLDLIKSTRFKHPYYWSSFIMLGNWL
ncbi:MAG: CHAT domain-containing protein [Cyanobacteria bacterium P01_G01_bin.19]